MRKMTEYLEVSECVVLSTCNRTEMYVYSESESVGVVYNLMEDVLLQCAGAEEEEDIGNYLLFFHGKKAIQHLFQVAAGLDSMVIGEDQILGQVKTAHQQARAAGTTGVLPDGGDQRQKGKNRYGFVENFGVHGDPCHQGGGGSAGHAQR